MLEHRKMCYKRKKFISRIDQQAELPNIKKEFLEYSNVYAQVLQEVTLRLDKTYKNFFCRVKNGEKPGFPRFKGKNQYDSFTYPQNGFWIVNNHLHLTKIGNIKINLHRPLEGKIKTCTIVRKNNKYYACFSCEVDIHILLQTNKTIGIDVGIVDYVITSDGEFFPKQDKYHKSEKRLKYLQRNMSRKKKGSNNRKRAVKLLAKQHEKVANQRKDYAHKVSTKLIRENDIIVYEDLQVENMIKNSSLAKSINDAGWGLLFRFLNYKAVEAGRRVVAVPPYQTSQKCSGCNKIVPKKLSERWHNCPHCGLSIQRDINAAINILNKGLILLKIA